MSHDHWHGGITGNAESNEKEGKNKSTKSAHSDRASSLRKRENRRYSAISSSFVKLNPAEHRGWVVR